MKMNKLSITEELDFQYLLTLLPPLSHIPEYAWLPELFSIVGHESLLLLSKYAGGEVIRIPTIDELSHALSALQLFYNVYISKKQPASAISKELESTINKILEVYNDVR